VLSSLVTGDTPSTRTARVAIEAAATGRRALVVLHRDEENAALSVRNLAEVHVLWVDQLNTYDVLVNDDVVFTSAAFDEFVAQRAGQEESK
jgi:large subunit ribosomal protein L4